MSAVTPHGEIIPAIPDTLILSADFNENILDIATALSLAIFRDGQAAFTANQSLGTFKLTNVGNGSNPQDAVTFLQVFTSPTFSNPTLSGTLVTVTATTLDASGVTTVTLPAGTSIGTVSAAEIAVLDGLTASTAELNILDGATLSTAELNLLTGALFTAVELGYLQGVTSGIQAQINGKAGLASPAFTGVPTAPTAAPYTATTQIATTEFVLAQSIIPGSIPAFLVMQAGII